MWAWAGGGPGPFEAEPCLGPLPLWCSPHLTLGSAYSAKAVFWKLRCPGKSMLQWTSPLKGDQGSGEARQ